MMMVKPSFLRALLAAPLLVLAAAPGCGGDTGGSSSGSGNDDCTEGANMTAPHLDGGVEQDAAGARIRIAWDVGTGRGAELPSSYFDTIVVEGEDAAAVASAKHTKDREITVSFSDLSAALSGQSSLAFTLVFADRKGFIDCSHPGMPDRYLLDVILGFDMSGMITSSTIEQRIELGDI